MNSKFDYDLLSAMMTNANMGWWEADLKTESYICSAMMTNANMGWWEADLKTESYICSEYISRLLGLDEDGTISFKDFNKRILKRRNNGILPHIPSTTSDRHKRPYICSIQQKDQRG